MLAGMLHHIPLSLFGKQCKQVPVYEFSQIRLLGSIPTPLNAAVLRLFLFKYTQATFSRKINKSVIEITLLFIIMCSISV